MGTLQRKTLTVGIDYACSQCQTEHQARAMLHVVPQPVVFGGSGGRSPTALWALRLRCPRTGEAKEEQIALGVPDGQRIVAVDAAEVLPEGVPAEASGAARQDEGPRSAAAGELAEARKESIPALRTIATTLLTTSTGGIPVYFAVLTYIQTPGPAKPWPWLAVVPPLLLILAAAAFVRCLLPSVKHVDAQDFVEARWAHIEVMGFRLRVGAILLLIAAAAAAIVFSLYSIA